MLRSSEASCNPLFQRIVQELLAEDKKFDRVENRSAHRLLLVRHVEIEFRDSGGIVHAFSRNISYEGVGIVTNCRIKEDSGALLKIARLPKSDVSFLATCKWCKEYGDGWFLSGWQFVNVKR